jgi:hypothetical protein
MDQEKDETGADKRRAKRSRVLLSAKLATDAGEIDVRLRNLSQFGALLACASPPATGSKVTFLRGETVVHAEVMWVDKEYFGIRFETPIEESEMLVHIAPTAPRTEVPAPEPQTQNYRSGFHHHILTPEERKLAEEWFSGGDRSHDISD